MLMKMIPEDCDTYEELADLAARHREDCEYFRSCQKIGIRVKKEVLEYMKEKTERIEKRLEWLDNQKRKAFVGLY